MVGIDFRPAGKRVLIAFAVCLLVLPPLSTYFGARYAVLASAIVLGTFVALSARSADGSDGSVWNAIPDRQYGGRHVESGGLTREEQERSIEEVQRQAEETMEHHER
ncbi:hypothetical protein [Halalkalicoccus tibetensis]|uniref:Uncharacterized protein n=1 Tax=Halalkalicoccus tibetensis TaxID=175632 RepID=A0ABD5UY34_9EURY